MSDYGGLIVAEYEIKVREKLKDYGCYFTRRGDLLFQGHNLLIAACVVI